MDQSKSLTNKKFGPEFCMSEYILVTSSFAQNVRKYAQGKRILDKNHVFEKGCTALWEDFELGRQKLSEVDLARKKSLEEVEKMKMDLQLAKAEVIQLKSELSALEKRELVKPISKHLGAGNFLKQMGNLTKSPHTEVKSPRSVTPILERSKYFGVDISTLDPPVPSCIEAILNLIEEKYLRVEGIFGKSASVKRMEYIRQELEKDISFDQICKVFDLEDPFIAHDFAGVVKLWYRSMKIPLFGFENFVLMCHLADADDYKELIQCVMELINSLPKNHKICLERIMATLHLVSLKSKHNGMTYQKISHAFSQSILRPPPTWSRQEVAEKTQSVIRVMRAVFMNSVTIFRFEDVDQSYSVAGSSEDEEYQRPEMFDL